jgi:uncharacterized protein YbaR (Trm112 family)
MRYEKCGNAAKLYQFLRRQRRITSEGDLMPVSEQLLEILVCPACRAKVELKPDGTALKCVECKRVYPIRDDIPVMLIDEAKIEDEQPAANN